MKFKLEIECNNGAFGSTATQRAEEVARIMDGVAARLVEREGVGYGVEFGVYDINGNRVGEARVVK